MTSFITSFLTIVLFSVAARSQVLDSSYVLRHPALFNQNSLFIKKTGDDNDFRDIVNLYSASLVYGFGVNLVRNGSGNQFPFHPLKTQGRATQILRALSIFDLYLTQGVQKKEKHPNFKTPATFDFVGSSVSPAGLSDKMEKEFERQGLKQVFERIAPVFSGSIHELPSDYKTDSKFVSNVHEGLKNKINQHWPISRPATGVPQRLVWLAESYLPFVFQANMQLVPKGLPASRLHMETYLPQVGELVADSNKLPHDWYIRSIVQNLTEQKKEIVSPPVVINEISLGKMFREDVVRTPGIKISLDKDFSKPDELDLTLEFGSIDVESSSQLGAMKFDEPEEALVARGYLQGYGLDGIQVRLGFHRLALRLLRPKSPTWNAALHNNYGFENIQVIRKKSLKSLTLYVPKSNYFVRSLLSVSVNSASCNSEYCKYLFSDDEKFESQYGRVNPINALLYVRFFGRKLLLGIVNLQGDNSIDSMTPGILREADAIVESIIQLVFEKSKVAQEALEKALSQFRIQ